MRHRQQPMSVSTIKFFRSLPLWVKIFSLMSLSHFILLGIATTVRSEKPFWYAYQVGNVRAVVLIQNQSPSTLYPVKETLCPESSRWYDALSLEKEHNVSFHPTEYHYLGCTASSVTLGGAK